MIGRPKIISTLTWVRDLFMNSGYSQWSNLMTLDVNRIPEEKKRDTIPFLENLGQLHKGSKMYYWLNIIMFNGWWVGLSMLIVGFLYWWDQDWFWYDGDHDPGVWPSIT